MKTKQEVKHIALEEALQEFSLWRSSRRKKGRIPQNLWSIAVRACRSHSVNVVSQALHINHTELKSRVKAQQSSPLPQKSCSEFVELPLASFHPSKGCVIEMEKPCGLKMRIVVQGELSPFALQMGQTFIGGKG